MWVDVGGERRGFFGEGEVGGADEFCEFDEAAGESGGESFV